MLETALVTGASGGIGEALAKLIAAGGRNVVLVARSGDKLQALAGDLARQHNIVATTIVANLSRPGSADEVVSALANRSIAIDILVNNAGFGTLGPFAEADADEQMRMVNVNVVTLTALTRRLLPGMLERRRGRVLNVASTAGFQPGPLMAVYYASKAYVVSLSEALAEETAGSGVTVTCLCPGPTPTGFQSRARMGNARLLQVAAKTSVADVARAGYDGMMAGRTLVIPGVFNKAAVQLVRVTPRKLMTRLVRGLHATH